MKIVATWNVEYTEVWDNLTECPGEVVVAIDRDQFADVLFVGGVVLNSVLNGTRLLYADDAGDDAKPIGETFVKSVRIDAVEMQANAVCMIFHEPE